MFYFILTILYCPLSIFLLTSSMDNFFGRHIKLLTFAAMASLTAILSRAAESSGTIFMAESPQGVCDHLDEALNLATLIAGTTEEIWIFVDVDDTLIADGSDTKSFFRLNNLARMKVVNEPLIQKLSGFKDNPSIKCVALTSALAWGIGRVKEEPGRVDAKPFPLSETQKTPISKIRADAMKALNMPFAASFGDDIRKLPFVIQDVAQDNQPTDEVISELRHFRLAQELEREEFFAGIEILHHPHKISPNSTVVQNDFYAKDPVDVIKGQRTGYAKILAWPVYANGVIFSNFLDSQQGWQKGAVMRSFLLARDRSQWPAVIIAIDDNLSMLKNMQSVSEELHIPLFAVHYNPPVFWIFPRR
jgi:hypothetical protein